MGPDRRGSRPITTWSPLSTRAAARPSTRASSGVSSALATPRTPSVPKRRAMEGPPRISAASWPRLGGPAQPGRRDLRGPCRKLRFRWGPSALGVLRRLAGLLEAGLLALLLAGVPRQEAGPLERAPHLG